MDEQHEPLLDDALLMDVIAHEWTLRSPPSSSSSESREGQVTSGTMTHETASETMPKPVKKQWKRRRDRNRPYREIPALQARAAELEQQLSELRTHANKRARCNLSAHSSNMTLKALVQEQHECIHDLEQLLNVQMDELVQSWPRTRISTSRVLPFDLVQDGHIFRLLAQNADDHYNNMSLALTLAGLLGTTSEVNDAHILRMNIEESGAQSIQLKSRTRAIVPFESRLVEQTLWKALQTDQVVSQRTVNDLGLPVGLASRMAVLKMEVVMGDYVCTMRMVMKQFVEGDRTVHVWDSLAEWPNVGTGSVVTTHENGWGYIQRVKDGVASVCECVLMTPIVHGAEDCATVEHLAKLYQQFLLSRLQLLENQTLDQILLDKKQAASINTL